MPIYKDGVAMPRLKFCHPFLARLGVIKDRRSVRPDSWKKEWASDIPTNGILVDNVQNKSPNFPKCLPFR